MTPVHALLKACTTKRTTPSRRVPLEPVVASEGSGINRSKGASSYSLIWAHMHMNQTPGTSAFPAHIQ